MKFHTTIPQPDGQAVDLFVRLINVPFEAGLTWVKGLGTMELAHNLTHGKVWRPKDGNLDLGKLLLAMPESWTRHIDILPLWPEHPLREWAHAHGHSVEGAAAQWLEHATIRSHGEESGAFCVPLTDEVNQAAQTIKATCWRAWPHLEHESWASWQALLGLPQDS